MKQKISLKIPKNLAKEKFDPFLSEQYKSGKTLQKHIGSKKAFTDNQKIDETAILYR